MMSTQDSLEIQRHKQDESKRMKDDIPCTQQPKEDRGRYTSITQNRF